MTTSRIWIVIHAILAISMPIALAFFSGCIKPPNLNKDGLGPEATETDIEGVVSKALYGIDPWKGQIGQQVIYDLNLRIENQEQTTTFRRITQTILNRTEDSTKLTLTVQNHDLDLANGTFERTENKVDYPRAAAVVASLSPIHKFVSIMATDRPVEKITYHNLKDSTGFMDPPTAVRERSNCGGVPGCQLRYVQIDYDEAHWFSDGTYEVHKWHFITSRDVPFLGHVFERCLAALQPINGRRYYIRQCQFTKDFSYAGATAP